MKLNRIGKRTCAIVAIISGTIYFLGGVAYPITQAALEGIWGMAVFCPYFKLEEEEE